MNPDSLQTVIDSLQQVIPSTPESSSFSWELLIAFVAIIIAPFIQYRIAKRQIHASTVTANRQEWINTLRNTVLEFISISYKFFIEKRFPVESENYVKELPTTLSNITVMQQKIELLLNPIEDKSQQLNSIIKEIIQHVRKDYPDFNVADNTEYNNLIESVKSITQEILKEEWERIKDGK